MVVNISIYVPLGLPRYLVFRTSGNRSSVCTGPCCWATVLSASVEMAQLYTPNRDTSLLDLITNIAGAALGVALALLFERMAVRRSRHALLTMA